MTKGRRHKSKMHEKFYGEPYKPKTLVEVKVCSKCGSKLPEDSVAKHCPYCLGSITTVYVSKN